MQLQIVLIPNGGHLQYLLVESDPCVLVAVAKYSSTSSGTWVSMIVSLPLAIRWRPGGKGFPDALRQVTKGSGWPVARPCNSMLEPRRTRVRPPSSPLGKTVTDGLTEKDTASTRNVECW